MKNTLARLLWGAAAILGVEFLLAAFVELRGMLDGDALIYLAMGRGILKGLTPYIDLFETKPPGIFLLSALSLQAFGNHMLGKVLQVIALAAIPASIALAARALLRRHPENAGLLWPMTLAFGLLLALFTAAFSGGLQVESFGAAAGCWYVGLVATKSDRWGWRRMIAGGIAIWLAIFFKEPFILSLFAVALFLAGSITALRTVFFLPAVIAGIIHVVVLTALGYLQPYFFYLSFMLNHHTNLYNGPLMLRALYLSRFAENHWLFAPAFPFLLLLIIVAALAHGWDDAPSSRARWWNVGRMLLGIYVLFLSVATGGDFYLHHFVFAVPGYAALFLLLLRAKLTDRMQAALFGIIVLILAATAWHLRENPARKIRDWQTWERELRANAATIDSALERCGIEHYLYLVSKGGGPFGFTRHSPLGPVFTNHNRFVMQEDSPLNDPFRTAFFESQLIVYKNEEQTGMAPTGLEYLRSQFTDVRPPCARDIEDPLPYRLLFRRTGT